MPLPSVLQDGDFLTSLSQDLAPHTSSPTDITKDVLASADPPTTLNYSFEFEEGDECGNPSELDCCSHESCEEDVEPTAFEFNDDILYAEYESFLYGLDLDVNVGLDVDLCAAYESFSFNPIQPDFLFESCKSKFVESNNIANKNFALDWTHMHIGLNRLVDFRPYDLPR